MAYAEKTTVPVEQSEAEIKATLRRYGADAFLSGTDEVEGRAFLGFRIENRHVKVILPIPKKDEFNRTAERGIVRSQQAQYKAWEQACRQRWRALALIVKAKLEAVHSGISSVEREFLSSIVLPNGTTFGEWAAPQIREIYDSGNMPPLIEA